jgi:Flp pilus assembly protein TadD
MNLARLYVLRNDKQQAREVLEELLQLQPENPGAKQALGMLQ